MKSIKQAVILAGGQGTRLRPLTFTKPKPMVPILGKPFLEYLIELLVKNNIEEIVILTGYLHEKIEEYFGDGKKFGVRITYSHSSVDDDTGTRLRKAKDLIDKEFLLMYSDNYWPLQLGELYSFYKKLGTDALVTIYSNLDNYTKNNISVNKDGFVEVYDKKKEQKGLNGVDIGFFILKREILDLLPSQNCSFETSVLPKLIAKKQLAGYLTYHKYYGLSNRERIPIIEDFFTPKKVVFLDRDGVINKKPPKAQYVTSWKDFVFLPKAKEALQILQKKGYLIFLVTNQPGIARGMMTDEQLQDIHKHLIEEMKKIGVTIRDIFICKHGWNDRCFCRKPNPGLFFQAAQQYNINLFQSYCIGDDDRDIVAGKAAHCETFLVDESNDFYTIVKSRL